MELREYLTEEGKSPFGSWLRSIKDMTVRAKIRVRLNRIRLGNFGDSKFVGEGVRELRLDFGPGYRVYFAQDGVVLVILLCGGTKKVKAKILPRQKCIGRTINGERVMSKLSKSYHQDLLKELKDPQAAAAYLSAALEDGSMEVFLLALRDVAEARGISKISRQTKLNRENLYRMLSEKGNPQLSSLSSLLKSCGLRLSVEASS